jgi:hypothetical protein
MKVARVGTRAVAVGGTDLVGPFRETHRIHARVSVSHPVDGGVTVRPAQAVVEVQRSMGGVIWRALLGGKWVPHAFEPPVVVLDVAISDAQQPSELMPDLLCDRHLLRSGLPDEFSSGVLKGLREAVVARGCPSGALSVDRAGFDEESGSVIFAGTARVLVNVLLALGSGADPLAAGAEELSRW